MPDSALNAQKHSVLVIDDEKMREIRTYKIGMHPRSR